MSFDPVRPAEVKVYNFDLLPTEEPSPPQVAIAHELRDRILEEEYGELFLAHVLGWRVRDLAKVVGMCEKKLSLRFKELKEKMREVFQ